MKTTSKTALVALTLAAAAIGGQAQAHTEWRYPFKGAPYAVPHEHSTGATNIRKSMSLSERAVDQRSILLAHHNTGHSLGPCGIFPCPQKPEGVAPKKVGQRGTAAPQAIVVAHHKPGYHDGLPRTSGPTVAAPRPAGNPRVDVGLPETGDLTLAFLA